MKCSKACRVVFLIVAVLLTACDLAANPEPTSVAEPLPSVVSNPAYPLPSGVSGAYPGPPAKIPPRTPVPPADAPVPITGKGSVSGILYSVKVRYVLPGTHFYLTRIKSPDQSAVLPPFSGPSAEDGDIEADTDANAQFRLNDVPPGDYNIAVQFAYSYTPAISSPNTEELLKFHVEANQRLALGVVYVPWP